jgi:HlyD family secretion protein
MTATLPPKAPQRIAKARKSKKRRNIILAILVVVLAGGAAYGRMIMKRDDAKPDRMDTVTQGTVETEVIENGSVQPFKTVEVKSKVAGRIHKLYVQEGSRVKAGQILADVDPTEINSQVAQYQAQLAGAEARLAQSKKSAVYQSEQTDAGIRQAHEALIAAQAQLKAAQEESAAQPGLTDSDIAQARANLKAAQDSVKLLQNSTQPQDRVQAQSNFDDAKESEATARKNLERQQQLLAKGFVSQQAVDSAATQLATAKSRLDQSKNKLSLIEEQQQLETAQAQSQVAQAQASLNRALANGSQVAIKKQQLASAKAAVEQSRAQYVSAQSNVQQNLIHNDMVDESRANVTQIQNALNEVLVHQNDTHLYASVGGVITKRYIEEGELITSGTSDFSSGTPVLQIADLSKMLVKMSVNEVDVNKIKPGQLVEIEVDGVKNHRFVGKVRKVAPASADNSQQGQGQGQGGVVRFAVEVLIEHPDDRLKPGMSAKNHIIIARDANVLRLPTDTVSGDGDKAMVQVKGPIKDGKQTYVKRNIVAGLRGDSFIEIKSGLKKGDQVKPGDFKGPKRQALDIMGN